MAEVERTNSEVLFQNLQKLKEETKLLRREYKEAKEKLDERSKRLAQLDTMIEKFGSTTHKGDLPTFNKVAIPDHIANNPEQVALCRDILGRWVVRKALRHFNSDSIRTYLSEKEAKQSRLRYKVLEEITETERTYLNGLNIVIEFKSAFSKEWESLEFIFNDIVIIKDLAEILLCLLEERLNLWPSVQSFGDIFVEQVPLMKIYHRYIRNYDNAQSLLNKLRMKKPKFNSFCQERASILGNEIISFLVMPVQRLPRYRLLLHSLVGYTPSTHVDHENLNHAIAEVDKITEYIEKRQAEAAETGDYEKLVKYISRGKILGHKKNVFGDCLKVEVGQLKIGPEKYSSPTIVKESHESQTMKDENPVFKDKLVIPITDMEASRKLVFKVLSDPSKVSSLTRHELGSIELDVQSLISAKNTEKWFTLTPSEYFKSKCPTSNLLLHLTISHHTLKEDVKVPGSSKIPTTLYMDEIKPSFLDEGLKSRSVRGFGSPFTKKDKEKEK